GCIPQPSNASACSAQRKWNPRSLEMIPVLPKEFPVKWQPSSGASRATLLNPCDLPRLAALRAAQGIGEIPVNSLLPGTAVRQTLAAPPDSPGEVAVKPFSKRTVVL